MAAIRFALVMLGRRSRGSSATTAASLGGTGLEIHQVFRPGALRTPPLPSLCPAGHSLESYRRFSGGRVPAENGLRMWWQRSMYRVKNVDIEQRYKYCFLYTMIVAGSSLCYLVKTMKDIKAMRHIQ